MKIAFDLDDTLLTAGDDFETEYPTRFFISKFLRYESLRKGTTDLFHHLQAKGHEIWIYTTSFRSPIYIRRLFWLYGIQLGGIVNQKRHSKTVKVKASKYPPAFGLDLLVDNSRGVKIEGENYNYNVICISPEDNNWTDTILQNIS